MKRKLTVDKAIDNCYNCYHSALLKCNIEDRYIVACYHPNFKDNKSAMVISKELDLNNNQDWLDMQTIPIPNICPLPEEK